jgi:hypothetical protein
LLQRQQVRAWIAGQRQFNTSRAGLRTRVVLKGNLILDAKDHQPLDGNAFAQMRGVTTLLDPSGDLIKGGDFEGWFFSTYAVQVASAQLQGAIHAGRPFPQIELEFDKPVTASTVRTEFGAVVPTVIVTYSFPGQATTTLPGTIGPKYTGGPPPTESTSFEFTPDQNSPLLPAPFTQVQVGMLLKGTGNSGDPVIRDVDGLALDGAKSEEPGSDVSYGFTFTTTF